MPETINIFAMNLGELETEVLKKLWVDAQEDSNGFAADAAFVNKYSRYRVRKKLNQAYSQMVSKSRALKSWFIITLSSGYSQYQIPLNCFDIDKVYYFTSATTYSELEVYEESYLEELIPGWKTVPGTPQYAYSADRNKMGVKLGVAPPPSADGTAITLGSGLYEGATPYGTVEGVSGSAGVGSGTNIYIDAHGQDFTALGVIIGLTILNITDGSKGVITSISTTNTDNDTINCSGNLSGGSTNIWTPGDEMRIIGGEYGGFIEIGDLDASYILSSIAGHLPRPGITMAAGNLLVQGFFYPTLLVDKYQYPELPPMFHPAIAIGAASLLGKEEPADSAEYAQAMKYEEEFVGQSMLLTGHISSQYKGDYGIVSKVR